MRTLLKSTGVAAVVTCAALLASAAQAHQFGRPVFYPVADPPTSLAAGDLNGDGRADLALTESQGGELQVLLGHGDGTFGSPITLTSGLSFDSTVTIADALGDGHNDVIAANSSSSNEVVIFPGNGDGTFGPPVDVAVKFQPNAVAVGDFNGDGQPDLAVADGDGNVEVLLGQGGGKFGSPAMLPLGSNITPVSIALARLTHSGHLDIVTAANGQSVSVLLGNGDGTFQPPFTIPLSLSPILANQSQSLTISDVNRDGVPDIVVIGGFSGANGTGVQVLLGQGDGTFVTKPAFAVNTGTYVTNGDSVPVADFTGDGIPDLAPDGVALYPGLGDGTFGPLLQPFAGVIPYPIGAVAADFNGDGKPDLAVGATDVNENANSADIAVLLNGADLNTGTPSLAPIGHLACYVVANTTFPRAPGLRTISFVGQHFYPGDSVQLATNLGGGNPGTVTGRVAPGGSVTLPWDAANFYSYFSGFQAKTLTFAAADQQDPTLAASTSVLVAHWTADIKIPLTGLPYISLTHRTTIHFFGFPPGSTLYEHYVHKGLRKTVKLGRVRGPCGAFKQAVRWAVPGVHKLPRSEASPAPRNVWTLQVDDHRSYSPRSSDQWRFTVIPVFP